VLREVLAQLVQEVEDILLGDGEVILELFSESLIPLIRDGEAECFDLK